MKKSKVIIPAMALLLFSTAASITGTVAWFTASRTFTTTAGDFQVANVDGNLNVEMAAGVATQAKDKEGNVTTTPSQATSISVPTGNQFTHGSFDTATQTAWIINKNTTGNGDLYLSKGTLTEAKSDPTKWESLSDATNTYYVAMSWTMTFKYTFNSESNDIGLYFNFGSSVLESTSVSATTATKKADNGFRIAFLPDSGTPKIWGKRGIGSTTGHEYDSLNYVIDSSSESISSYNSGNYMYSGQTYSVATDGATAADDTANKARPDRLGTITKAGATQGVGSLTVQCVVWFEGMDADVVSEAELFKVKATMDFYVRSDSVVTSGN